MMAPSSAACSSRRQCPICSGVSRGISTSRRRSFSTTSAARCTRWSPFPVAIAASVRTLHGAISIPSVKNDPLQIAAPMSPGLYQRVASAFTCSTVKSVSCSIVRTAHALMMTCVSTPASRSNSSARTP